MSLGVTLCSLSTLLKLRANPPHKVLKARKLKKNVLVSEMQTISAYSAFL